MDDRTQEIEATFERIRRPLRWPMERFKRTKVRTKGFVGYRFSRIRRSAAAGFAFGFVLRDGVLPIPVAPPEAVAYAFVSPVDSALYRDLVTRPNSPIRRLVRAGEREALPFEFHPGFEAAVIRHRSMQRPPPEIFVLAASDFFVLTFRPLRASGFQERVIKATTRPGP